jgi:hypothetical protein
MAKASVPDTQSKKSRTSLPAWMHEHEAELTLPSFRPEPDGPKPGPPPIREPGKPPPPAGDPPPDEPPREDPPRRPPDPGERPPAIQEPPRRLDYLVALKSSRLRSENGGPNRRHVAAAARGSR